MDDDNSYTKQGDAFACPLTLDTVSESTVFCRAPPLALGLTIGPYEPNRLAAKSYSSSLIRIGLANATTYFKHFK